MKISSASDALNAIEAEAGQDAIKWLQREFPRCYDAIEYLIHTEKWGFQQTTDEIKKIFGETREKTQHKMDLVIKCLIMERDNT